MGGADSLTPQPHAWAKTSMKSWEVRLSLHHENRQSDGGPLPTQGCTASSPPTHGYGWGGAQGSKVKAILPLPKDAKLYPPRLKDAKHCVLPFSPRHHPPPKKKKPQSVGDPKNLIKPQGSPPHSFPPRSHPLTSAGSEGGLRASCAAPAAPGRCGAAAAAVPGAPLRSAVRAQRMSPPAPLRPAPPRSASLRSGRAAPAPPPPVLRELRAPARCGAGAFPSPLPCDGHFSAGPAAG